MYLFSTCNPPNIASSAVSMLTQTKPHTAQTMQKVMSIIFQFLCKYKPKCACVTNKKGDALHRLTLWNNYKKLHNRTNRTYFKHLQI